MSILVFIEDYVPSAEERALAEKCGTKKFRTLHASAYPIEHHTLAVALDPSRVPEGYNTKEEAPATEGSEEGLENDPSQDPAPSQEDATNSPVPDWRKAGQDAPIRGQMAD